MSDTRIILTRSSEFRYKLPTSCLIRHIYCRKEFEMQLVTITDEMVHTVHHINPLFHEFYFTSVFKI